MTKGLILAALLLTACGSGETYTSNVEQRPTRCFELELQCRFNDNKLGCLAIKQTAEQGAKDDSFYAEFCLARG